MKRPFAKYRPLGPFSQSDSFSDKFLSGENEIKEGSKYLLMVQTLNDENVSVVKDEIRNTMTSIRDFIDLRRAGVIKDGRIYSKGQTNPEHRFHATLMLAKEVNDSDVTQNQIQKVFSKNLSAALSKSLRDDAFSGVRNKNKDNAIIETYFMEVDI
jgi:hypothetical protein